MDFFEKIGKKATETYKTAAEKTGKIADDTKLKMKISGNKSKINVIYEEIGKKVYQKYILEGNLEIKDDITEDLSKIDELAKEIEEYELQRLKLAEKKKCINCEKVLEKYTKYCSECGTKQPEIEEEQTTDNSTEETVENTEEIVVEVVSEEKNENNNE